MLGSAPGFLLYVFVITATFEEVIRGLPLSRLRPLTVSELLLLWIELGLLMGIPVGLGQTLVLKSFVRKGHSLLWLLLTTTGYGLGMIAFFGAQLLILNRTFSFVLYNAAYWKTAPIIVLTAGIIISTAQWLALRNSTTRAVYWIPIGSVSLGVAWLVASITADLWRTYPSEDSVLHAFELVAIFIAIYSALTGIGLALVLQEKTPAVSVDKTTRNVKTQ